MKLQHNKLWLAISLGFLSGPALAATINCTLTPANSVITQGETLQLAATCEGGPLEKITWKQGTTALAADVPLSGDTSKPIYYTAPAGAAGNFIFTVSGVPLNDTDTFGLSSEARVRVEAAPAANFGGTTTAAFSPTPPVDAACGSAAINGTAVQSMPTNGQQCDLSKGKPALAITGPSSYSWSCISLTGGAEANCYVPRGVAYTVTASAGANGTITPSGSQSVNANTTTSFTVTPAANYNIASVTGCNGTLTGSTYTTGAIAGACSVSATFAAQASSYTVTATAGTGGSISPAGTQTVNANGTASFTVTPASGYTVSGVIGCNGTLAGSTYTTGAITGACTVAASFAAQSVQTGDDTGIGSGLWVPAGYPNLYVVDQSGTGITTSYVPGCVNGTDPGSSSWTGCAANNSFTTNGVKIEAMKGKVLSVRYKSNSTAGTTKKWFTVTGFDGGNTGPVYVWLTDDPRNTYAQTDSKCKAYSTSAPSVVTGYYKTSTYCQISANKVYYLNIESDMTTPQKFKIFEEASDMLP